MTNARLFRIAPAIIVAALAFPALTVAQPAATGPATPVPAPGAPAAPRAARRPAAKPTDMVEQRITELHTKLKITPAQAPQWDAFANVMRENARGMETAYETRASSRQTMNAVDNMQSYATLADQHAQDLRKLAPAFASVYGTMSDEQKRNADMVFRSAGNEAAARRQR